MTTTVTSAATFLSGPGTLDDLAWAIDVDGIGCHEAAIARVVTWARTMGFDPVLLDVLADPTEPVTARERAFGALTRTAARGGLVERPLGPPGRIAA